MKVKAFVILLLVCVVFTVVASANNGFMLYSSNGYNQPYDDPTILVDNETGVNYIFIQVNSRLGAPSIALCPRYRSDGSLWVDSEY